MSVHVFSHRRRKRSLLGVTAMLLIIGVGGFLRAADESSSKEQPFHYDPGDHRDPFTPLVRDGRLVVVEHGSRQDLKPVLYGILWDPGGHSIALLNDVEAKVNDVVGEYRVAEIRPDAVVVTNGEEELVLSISFDTSQKSKADTRNVATPPSESSKQRR